jgi:ornithine cyclodeaminase/alanine dehydrogenase-like protein (mu-crystallin family)
MPAFAEKVWQVFQVDVDVSRLIGLDAAVLGARSLDLEAAQIAYAQSRLFCDLPAQSASIGEFQHADAGTPLMAMGTVLTNTTEGRRTSEDITIFDSSGIALQDLYMAEATIASTSS